MPDNRYNKIELLRKEMHVRFMSIGLKDEKHMITIT